MKYRKLSAEEISALQQQGCTAADWQQLDVAEGFSPAYIARTAFSGQIRLGCFDKTFTLPGGLERHSGICDATLHNVSIGNDCCIRAVREYIANYDIAEGVLIDNAGTIVTDAESSFGNGVKVSVLNETGGREVLIHDRLSAHEAYMTALYRHRPEFVERMNAIICGYVKSVRSSRGVIGKGSSITGTAEIRNVRIGECASIHGAALLANGSVNSSEDAPVTIGQSVICEDFIISGGSSVTDAATLEFTVNLAEGTPYIVSFWAKTLGEEGFVKVTSGDNQNAETAVTPEWNKYSVTLPTKSVGAFSYRLTASKDVVIDNIRVIETVIEEDDKPAGGAYINPYAIDGGLDFEGYVSGTTAAQLLEAGWTQINGAAYVYVTDEYANSGSLSLKMDNGDGHGGNAWDIQAITPSFAVTAGTTYRIAWYARANVEADLQIDIREDGSAKAYKNSAWGNYDKMGTDWTYQWVDYTVEEGSELSVAFYGATEAATYYIDDIQVFEAIKEGDYTNYIDKTNLLSDPDFEGEGVWGVWNGSEYVTLLSRNEPEIGANADCIHSGLHAYKVDNTETGWTGGNSWHIQIANNTPVEVTPGASYRIGMWVKSPDGATTIQVHLTFQDGGPGTSYIQIPGIGEDWTFIYIDKVMPDDAETVQLVIDAAYDAATYYIDDVQFFPTPVESYIDPASVLTNGDFEDITDDFPTGISRNNGGEYISLSSEEAHSGSYSIKVDNTEPVATGGSAWKVQFGHPYNTPEAKVQGGKTYRYGVWVKSPDAADDAQIQLYAKHFTGDDASGTENYRQAGPVTSDWTFIYTDIDVADDVDGLYLTIQAAYSEGTFYFDDWQCFPVEASAASIAAHRGYGKYPTWVRPAPATNRIKRAANEFATTTKLDGELADDAIGVAYKNWVYAMVDHFDVYAWDVVNETFTEDGNFRTKENSQDESFFIWGTWFGGTKNWVDKAFAYATDAAGLYGKTPDLYINDYNLETSEAKRKAFCEYASGNDQVTGVGTQMHLDMATEDLETKIEASLKDLVATGKKVRISELDIKCTDLQAQADLYVYIFTKYLEIVPEAQRGGITIWGTNDKDSWVGESNAPLLYSGSKYERKPAYEALYIYLCDLAGVNPYQEDEAEE